jgi:glycosyltransferase involved in cell wall biosynthesis
MSIRVLHLRSSAGFFGAERVIVTLMASTSRDENVETFLACIENYINGDRSLLHHAQEAGLSAVELPCKSRMDLGTIRHLRQFCKTNKIDIIHTHDYKSLFYGIIVSKLSGFKLVTTLHGKTSGDAKNRLYELIENRLLNLVNHITVVSKPLLKLLSNAGLDKKTTLIANGVDEINFKPGATGFGKPYWGFESDCFLFGTIARMSEEKGHEFLLKTFVNFAVKEDKARLLFIGDGPLEQDLKILAEERGISEKVCFAGPRKEVEKILNDLDCYVSPSHTEGMPMSILEAMATALPIIATNVGSVGDMLSNESGRLIQAGDSPALLEQMHYALEYPEQMKALGENARSKVESTYSAAIQRHEYANIYHSLIS